MAKRTVEGFCGELIEAAHATRGLKWPRFISRAAVASELRNRGYTLRQDTLGTWFASLNSDPSPMVLP